MANRFLTRRGLFATSGAALAASGPLVLAACGDTESDDEETSPGREAELLRAIAAQQAGVIQACVLAQHSAPSELRPSIIQLRKTRQEFSQELNRMINELGVKGEHPQYKLVGGESPTEGVARQLEFSIAFSLERIGELNPKHRAPVHHAVTEDAAVLAAARATLGEEIAPDAFVMGPPAARAAA